MMWYSPVGEKSLLSLFYAHSKYLYKRLRMLSLFVHSLSGAVGLSAYCILNVDLHGVRFFFFIPLFLPKMLNFFDTNSRC